MSFDRTARIAWLKEEAKKRILLLDGAWGVMIQGYGLSEEDFRGSRFGNHAHDLKGNNDLLTLTRPDIVSDIARAYLDAGADIIETNTFNSTAISQADYRLEHLVAELNEEGARLARTICNEAETRTRPRLVAGVIGPTNRTASLSPDVNDPGFRNIAFDELRETYREAARALIRGGADLIIIDAKCSAQDRHYTEGVEEASAHPEPLDVLDLAPGRDVEEPRTPREDAREALLLVPDPLPLGEGEIGIA